MVKWKTSLAENKDFTQAQKNRLHELTIARGSLDSVANVSQQSILLWTPHPLTFLCSVSVWNCCLLPDVSSPCNPLLVGNVCFRAWRTQFAFWDSAIILPNFMQTQLVVAAGMPVYVCAWVCGCLLACVNPVKSVCVYVYVCVGGCYLPPATFHLSVELARLKLACSLTLKAINPLSGHRTLSILELKAEFPLVTVCTRSKLSESQSKGWRIITDPGSDECEGNCQNWCDTFPALGVQSQCLTAGIETARRRIWPAAATQCHVTST